MPNQSQIASENSPADPAERLIVALDVPSLDRAHELIKQFGETVKFYKIGLELFMQEGTFGLIKELKEKGKKVFVDLKFHDVSRTVAAAVAKLSNLDVDFITVQTYSSTLKAAVEAKATFEPFEK